MGAATRGRTIDAMPAARGAPRHRLDETRLELAIRQCFRRLGRAPNASELAGELDVDRAAVLAALTLRYSSASTPGEPDDEGPHDADDDSALTCFESHVGLAVALSALPGLERRVLQLRLCGALRQSEIAERLGISPRRVAQLLSQTLAELRDHL